MFPGFGLKNFYYRYTKINKCNIIIESFKYKDSFYSWKSFKSIMRERERENF